MPANRLQPHAGSTRQEGFLHRCDPRAKLGAFFLLMPVILAEPLAAPVWWAGAVLALTGLVLAAAPTAALRNTLFRLRWLFLLLLLTHGYMTPGHPLWPSGTDPPALPLPSREGLLTGLHQSGRLILIAALAWCLMRTTTPLQLVAAFRRLFIRLEGTPFSPQRFWAVLVFALERIPRLMRTAQGVNADLTLRRTGGAGRGRLRHLALAGEALLARLLCDVRRQEEALHARGFDSGLPSPPLSRSPMGWRDGVILLLPAGLLLAVGAGY